MEIIKTKKDLLFMLVFVSFMVFSIWDKEDWEVEEYVPTRLTPQQEYDLKACSKDGFSKQQIVDCSIERIQKRIQEEQQREEEHLFYKL